MRQDDEDVGIDAADVDEIRGIISELDGSELELLDPPAEIWDGIEASVSSMRARQAPSTVSPAQLVVEYWIDAGDVLTEVREGWAEFARENWAPELAVPPSGRTLWSYIGGAEITELWQLLVQRVRTVQRPARVPFRCDAPHARRWFEMTVEPAPREGVHFRSVLVFEEARPPVALLDPDAGRDADAHPVPLCSWCGRAQHGSRWLDIEELLETGRLLEQSTPPPVAYGICAACRQEMAADLLVPEHAGHDAS